MGAGTQRAAAYHLGVLMALLPAAGLLSIAWLIGTFALLIGVVMIALAFRLRRLRSA
ncbi:DUF308 domain-containing protein [Paracoccus kondratievae]